MEEEDILATLLKIARTGIEVLDQEDSEDNKALCGLFDCVDIALTLPRKKKKRVWIKAWEDQGNEGGVCSMDSKERQAEAFAVCCNLLGLTKNQFEALFNNFGDDLQRQNTLMRDAVSPIEKFSAVLRIMATGCSYKATCLQTRLSQSFICCATPSVCKSIWNSLEDKYMRTPSTPTDWESIATEFALKYQFPNCLGALFAKQIEFRSLKREKELYLNSKLKTTIILLAVVDANCRFIYVDVTSTGAVDDATALSQSSLGKMLGNTELNLPPNRAVGRKRKLPYVFLAGKTFPLQKNIMIPYNRKELTQENSVFNSRLNLAREVVDQAFNIMTQRFKIFQNIISFRADNVLNITKACCMLHNYLLEHDEDYINLYPDIETNDNEDDEEEEHLYDEEAEEVRQGFVSYFNSQGRMPWHNANEYN